MTPHRLRILLLTATREESDFAALVLRDHGDEVTVATDIRHCIELLDKQSFELLMMGLTLPRGDGLALVHNVRALYPNVDIVVFSRPEEIETTAHAVALGVMQTVVLPLTGDAVLVAADRARERRALVAERSRLAALEANSRRRMATYARCAELVAEVDAQSVAKRVLEACVGELEVKAGAIYIPISPGAPGLTRASTLGEAKDFPIELDEETVGSLDPTVVVHRVGDKVYVSLIGDVDVLAIVLLIPTDPTVPEAAVHGLEMVAALGVGAFVAAAKVDAIARTGIKDPETSAYTFAYFGDAAGREIARAARHGRRFAMLTLEFDRVGALRPTLTSTELLEFRRMISDALLDVVRDSDVLARVEDDEFYLLLPETGMLGALAARRRIRRRFDAVPEMIQFVPEASLDPVVGIAVYPADGADLGRLMRRGRDRGERSAAGVWRRLRLLRQGFWDAVDLLLGSERDVTVGPEGQFALGPGMERTHDEAALARHAILPASLLPRLAAQMTADAVRHRVHGNIYVAGDDALATAIGQAVAQDGSSPLRAWVLGDRSGPSERLRLPVTEPRLGSLSFILGLTDLGGYFLAARRLSGSRVLVYHTSDLDLVDGLVAALQANYHLQPGFAS